jgi:hypothetical protein
LLDRIMEDQAADQERRQVTAQARDAWLKVDALVQALSHLTQHDPEQEVQGMALPVMAEVIEMARSCVSVRALG